MNGRRDPLTVEKVVVVFRWYLLWWSRSLRR
jgi:hypothetical protein